MVPVRINEAVILPFFLDSGAAAVVIPEDVLSTLLRTGTVKKSDFIGSGKVTLADGSEYLSRLFMLNEVRVGDHVVRNVVANVAPVKGDPLLGQSFLSKLPAWTIDNERHALVFNDVPAAVSAQQQRLALPSAQTAPRERTAQVVSPDEPSGERSLEVVRSFYFALGHADGVNASRLVIPEKRIKGPFAASEINTFYSSLAVPLQLLEMKLASNNIVEVQYQYSTADRKPCHGRAVVNLVSRGDELLIEAIRALNHC
jgi:hypothetical protein